MLISPLSNSYTQFNSYNTKRTSKISFGQRVTDCFEKKEKEIDKIKLLEILTGDFRKLNDDFFKSLSKEEYQFCLDWANGNEKIFSGMVQFSPKSVIPEDVKSVVKYGDFFYTGLQKIAKQSGKDMTQILLVGIGQSPIVSIKLLELIGVKTAYCPISGLTTFDEPVEKYVTKENIDKYFKYWNNFGFNIDDLFGDKLIIFTDHKETGRTFEVFKKIVSEIINIKKDEMKKFGKKPAKIKFLPLDKIYKTSQKESKEKKWGKDFANSVFHTSYLKTLYSPLFKLPLPNIKEIAKRHQLAKDSDRSIRFNKLTVLMYDELYHPKNNIQERKYSSIDAERQFRLSFYTPETT